MNRIRLTKIADKILTDLGRSTVHASLLDELRPKKKGNGFLKPGQCPPWLEKFKWTPGMPSPNPTGIRKSMPKISIEIKNRLGEIVPGTEITYAKAIAVALVHKAMMGDIWAAREVREVTEGLLRQKTEVEFRGNLSLVHRQIEDMTDAELNAIVDDYVKGRLEEQHGKENENDRPASEVPSDGPS